MKTYLGNGAFAEINDNQLILTAQDGIRITARVTLGAPEWKALVAWVNRCMEERRETLQELTR